MASSAPVFIVGMPRSGTTLMRSLLSAHSRIAVAPETHFLNLWVKQFCHLDLRREDEFGLFWREFSASSEFSKLGIDIHRTLDRILSKGSPDFRKVFQAILEEYAAMKGKERWGEKTPAHYAYVDILLSWFPDAHIIWMLRDPRAVCASYLKVPWSVKHVLSPARRWVDSMRHLEQWQDHPQVKVVRYEDLVSSPKEVLNEVLAYVNEQAIAELKDQRRLRDPEIGNYDRWARQHFDVASGPVCCQSLKKWHKELTPSQVRLIEFVTSRWMPMGEYSCMYSRSHWSRLWMRVRFVLSNISYLMRLVWTKVVKSFVHYRLLSSRSLDSCSSPKVLVKNENAYQGNEITFLVWGYYGERNLGDDAMLRVIVDHLRLHWPRSRILVTSRDPVLVESQLEVSAPWPLRSGRRFSLRREIEFIREARKANIILMGGGTFLQDYGRMWNTLVIRLMRVAVLRLLGKRIFILGGGAAELHSLIGRWAAQWIVRLCHKAVFRDIESVRLLEHLGVPSSKMALSADLAFLLSSREGSWSASPGRNQLSGKYKLGVNVLNYGKIVGDVTKERWFVDVMARVLDRICTTWGCEIHFIPMMEGVVKNDRRISEQIANEMSHPEDVRIHEYSDMNTTLDTIAHMDIAVGMRLHFLIFCYLFDVPAVGLAYNTKVKSFMDSVNAGQWCLPNLDRLTEDNLVRKLERLRQSRSIYPAREELLHRMRQLAKRNFEPLNTLLLAKRSLDG